MFSTKSVDTVLKTFTAAISDLAKIEDRCNADITTAGDTIIKAQSVQEAADAERVRAASVRAKLEALVS